VADHALWFGAEVVVVFGTHVDGGRAFMASAVTWVAFTGTGLGVCMILNGVPATVIHETLSWI
jgi:hypothetical protein